MTNHTITVPSLRGACTASDEAIQSKPLNLPDCRVGLTPSSHVYRSRQKKVAV
ncbi:MAG: hypothetical protein LBK53_02455 [Heliobacteriaceae bacterium]|nr:hypothetical protein [Heliobacteriaceae bacterium]